MEKKNHFISSPDPDNTIPSEWVAQTVCAAEGWRLLPWWWRSGRKLSSINEFGVNFILKKFYKVETFVKSTLNFPHLWNYVKNNSMSWVVFGLMETYFSERPQNRNHQLFLNLQSFCYQFKAIIMINISVLNTEGQMIGWNFVTISAHFQISKSQQAKGLSHFALTPRFPIFHRESTILSEPLQTGLQRRHKGKGPHRGCARTSDW